MQVMPGKSGKVLLIIFCLMPGSVTSSQCSNRAEALQVCFCPCLCENTTSLFQNEPEECTSVSSRRPLNSDFPFGNALIYILIDLAPLMVYFPVLILFNINLASGPGQSFLFFYQALTAATGVDYFWGMLTMGSPVNNYIFPHTLPFISLQYCKLGVAVMAIFMTVVLVTCVHCPCASWRRPWAKLRHSVRHFQEKHACKGTVLNGLCSIAILTYGFVVQHSFTILRPTSCCPNGAKHCAHYCTELEYGDYRFSLLVAAAVICLFLALLLPLLLLYYPCVPALMQRVTKRSPQFMTCHKLAPVLDVFQSAYKPKLQFFAAFPLLYRFVIWCLFSALSAELGRNDILTVITLAFIVILAIHSLVQPYSEPKHNYIETLYLVNLVLISMMLLIKQLATVSLYSGSESKLTGLLFLPFVLICLPIVICVGYFFWKHKCCKRCRACCKRVKRSRRSAQSEAVQATSSAVSLTEVYFDMSEVEQLNQDL